MRCTFLVELQKDIVIQVLPCFTFNDYLPRSGPEPVLRRSDGSGVSARPVDVSKVLALVVARALRHVLRVGALAVHAGAGAHVEDGAERATVLSGNSSDAEEVLAAVGGVGVLCEHSGAGVAGALELTSLVVWIETGRG